MYTRPQCGMCDAPSDVRDVAGTWCARHSKEGWESLRYACKGCGVPFHPDRLDDETGTCLQCTADAWELDDQGMRNV
jgi:hypothetical protein